MNYLKLLFDLYNAKRNVKKSAKQIKKLQQKKLRKMLKYAYNHSEYYRQAFQAAGITDKNINITPLEAFPAIDKQGLLKYFDKLITVSDRLSDSLTFQSADESCPFTRAVGLLGRNEDVLWFEDGNGNREFLHPLAVEGFCIEGLMDYQFVQLGNKSFEMRAQISQTASRAVIRAEILKEMKAVLKEKNLEYVQFSVKFADEIKPDTNTGKKRLIVSFSQYDIKEAAV